MILRVVRICVKRDPPLCHLVYPNAAPHVQYDWRIDSETASKEPDTETCASLQGALVGKGVVT